MDWLDRQATSVNHIFGQGSWDPFHILRVQHKLGKAIKSAEHSLAAKVFVAEGAKGSPPAGPFCRAELCCFTGRCCDPCSIDDPDPENAFTACLKSAPDHCCGTDGNCSEPGKCGGAVARGAEVGEIMSEGECNDAFLECQGQAEAKTARELVMDHDVMHKVYGINLAAFRQAAEPIPELFVEAIRECTHCIHKDQNIRKKAMTNHKCACATSRSS